jgi:hypothetical protein
MDREILTNETGGVIESNLTVAVSQGRISEGEKPRWRAEYEKSPYEKVTAMLLSRKPARATQRPAVRAAGTTFSERQINDYMARVLPPSWQLP